MANLDKFYEGILTQDNRLRTATHAQLVDFLQNPVTSCTAENIDQLIDGLAGWVNSSNFKVSLNGLEVLHLLINRMGEKFRPYIPNVLETTLNRLGDMHDDVRDAAQNVLLALMYPASSPGFIFERIWPQASAHKQFRVREGICLCLQNLLRSYGAKSIQLSKIVPNLVKLMDDSNSQVRDASLAALVEIYRYSGEKVRQDLLKKGLPTSKMNLINEKFDEVKASGDMLPESLNTMTSSITKQYDDVDSMKPPRNAPVYQSSVTSSAPSASTPMSSALPKTKAAKPSASAKSSGAGALSEDMFSSSFDQVPKIHIFSCKDVEEKLQSACNVISNVNADWEKRVHELKICRAIILQGGANYDEFYAYMRQMETAFVAAVKDLRSQVVREACITIAFFAENLENRLEHFCEMVLTGLINLIPNSAKVMATSGTTALKFIVQYVHSQRLIPIIAEHTKSKSNIIRRYCYELIEALLGLWQTHNIEKHASLLSEAIKRGINDADADARTFSRKSFWLFSQHFKYQADMLYESLDSARQKQLQGELSNASSSNSINSQSSSSKPPAGDRVDSGSNFSDPTQRDAMRSSARGRLTGAASAKTNTATRQRKISATGSITDSGINGKSKKSSQSQPGSRSNSPSRLLFPSVTSAGSSSVGRTKMKSNIPRSQGASREASPSRYGSSSGKGITTPSHQRASSQSSNSNSPRFVEYSQDTEDLLAEKLNGQLNRRYDYNSDDDAGSEVSSVHSESLSQYVGSGRCTEDINEIQRLMLSNQWNERKEGLMSLQYFITHIRSLTPSELKRVTEVFTRMFHEPHAKVFSIFMDTLIEVITIHKHLLHEWLPTLLSKMLVKCGGDMLASVATRTQKTLDTIMETFDNVSQFCALMKFLGDNIQSHNFKVKLQYLSYLYQLMQQMEMSQFVNNADTRSAISKIISWIDEPKSAETRNASKSVIVSMFNLNPPEFSTLITGLQKSLQDTAHKVISSHVQGLADALESPINPLSQMGTRVKHHSPNQLVSPRRRNASNSSTTSDADVFTTTKTPLRMNSDEIFRSIRQTTADIQNLSISSKLDPDDITKERDSTSQDSGIQSSMPDVRSDSPAHNGARGTYKPSKYLAPSPSNQNNGFKKQAAGLSHSPPGLMDDDEEDEDSSDDMPLDPSDPFSQILEELSNHEQRYEERKKAMNDLIDMTRKGGNGARWDEHFKTLLLLLLETLGDREALIRAQALQVLREIIKWEKHRFDHYAELTILKVIEAHKDADKEVCRAAEECASTLAKSIKPEHSVIVLAKLMESLDYPLSVAVIKTLTQVIELMNKERLLDVIHRLIPGLVKGYEHEESLCRKASCFALVALYMKIGEQLMPYLNSLSGSKLKLLNLYIKRAEEKS